MTTFRPRDVLHRCLPGIFRKATPQKSSTRSRGRAHSGKSRQPKGRCHFRPALESLESRELFSADGVSAGALTDVLANSSSGVPALVVGGQQSMPANLDQVAGKLMHSADSYGSFVNWAYQHFMDRAPDTAGFDFWVAKMQAGVTNEQIEATFLAAPEYIAGHGGSDVNWVIGMYHDLLHRAPEVQGIAYWSQQIEAGMPEYTIALDFAAGPERESLVVQNDYSVLLGRPATQADVNYWVGQFLHGASNEDLIAGFIASPEYYNNPHKGGGDPTTWLDSVFEDVLNRMPTDAELSSWLGQMRNGQQTPISGEPAIDANAGGYAPMSGTLFDPHGPSYADVQQGAFLGDCWLLASLAEVAARDPQAISDMFTYQGTGAINGATVGLFSVRFFDPNGQAHYVTVDTELPGGGQYYDHVQNGVLWVALAEKAYAEANAQGFVTVQPQHQGQNSYAAL